MSKSIENALGGEGVSKGLSDFLFCLLRRRGVNPSREPIGLLPVPDANDLFLIEGERRPCGAPRSFGRLIECFRFGPRDQSRKRWHVRLRLPVWSCPSSDAFAPKAVRYRLSATMRSLPRKPAGILFFARPVRLRNAVRRIRIDRLRRNSRILGADSDGDNAAEQFRDEGRRGIAEGHL